jgi:hypothetical protein
MNGLEKLVQLRGGLDAIPSALALKLALLVSYGIQLRQYISNPLICQV